MTLRMPSAEVRLVRKECMATIGQVGNIDHTNVKLGKAGRKRWLGWRPTVRGSAMSPRDHPMVVVKAAPLSGCPGLSPLGAGIHWTQDAQQ